ncbi:hypothetical protein PF008_g6118 [Phytophthora fragariae]|uniref:Ribonuclease H1 N-terminal domain-containing protein n=1 Tax=Phytophthora fragariae TaxID=53985 RepID=A0A6G0S6E3_9STRA|nr:hypothetical protein PF008_g6118 [Phytophthora fragariae]
MLEVKVVLAATLDALAQLRFLLEPSSLPAETTLSLFDTSAAFDQFTSSSSLLRGDAILLLENAAPRPISPAYWQTMSDPVVFYAVTRGRCSGVFMSLSRVKDATVGYPGGKFGSFSTLPEAEAFIIKEEERVANRSNEAAVGWSGSAYAVAVGRRMGVFRHRHEALSQTLCYSGNSLKKFPTYAQAVEFLDHHNWRKMPGNSKEITRVEPESCIVISSSDEDTSAEEENPQDSEGSVITHKRERDEERPEALRAAQRRRIDKDDMLLPGKTDLIAICCGKHALDRDGKEVVQMICQFPAHSEWNVVETLSGSDATIMRAGLLAVLELLKRATKEDPSHKTDVVVFTVGRPLFDVVSDCARDGWQSVQDNRDLLERIAKEKSDRRMKFLHFGGTCLWTAEQPQRVENEVSL